MIDLHNQLYYVYNNAICGLVKMKDYCVYILASKRNGTLYIGVTGNIAERMYQHRSKLLKGLTSKYDVVKLVYTEDYSNPRDAIHREKQLKKSKRSWKIALIESQNPDWHDYAEDFLL